MPSPATPGPDRLWSPWRSAHLAAPPPAEPVDDRSVFARIAASDDDDANLVIWRGTHVFVLMNLYPYNNGHVLIVPYREVADYTALTPDERAELADATDRALRWLGEALRPDGYNVGMNLGEAGGAGVPTHLHQHIVPRWRGDTNFMPTLAQTKVVPEALRASYARICAAARSLGDLPPS